MLKEINFILISPLNKSKVIHLLKVITHQDIAAKGVLLWTRTTGCGTDSFVGGGKIFGQHRDEFR